MIKLVSNIPEGWPRSRDIIVAENETWDKETCEELRNKYNILYSPNYPCPLKVLCDTSDEKYIDNPFIVFGHEDDGTIYFNKYASGYDNVIRYSKIDMLIKSLQQIKKYAKEIKMKKYRITFEVCLATNHKDIRSVVVEASSKTNAYSKGLREMSSIKEFQNMFKKIINIEEI